jgi:hypothetical protein
MPTLIFTDGVAESSSTRLDTIRVQTSSSHSCASRRLAALTWSPSSGYPRPLGFRIAWLPESNFSLLAPTLPCLNVALASCFLCGLTPMISSLDTVLHVEYPGLTTSRPLAVITRGHFHPNDSLSSGLMRLPMLPPVPMFGCTT